MACPSKSLGSLASGRTQPGGRGLAASLGSGAGGGVLGQPLPLCEDGHGRFPSARMDTGPQGSFQLTVCHLLPLPSPREQEGRAAWSLARSLGKMDGCSQPLLSWTPAGQTAEHLVAKLAYKVLKVKPLPCLTGAW